jgi:hypothetical protein
MLSKNKEVLTKENVENLLRQLQPFELKFLAEDPGSFSFVTADTDIGRTKPLVLTHCEEANPQSFSEFMNWLRDETGKLVRPKS